MNQIPSPQGKRRFPIHRYHLFGLITIIFWASSFAFTKVSLEVFTVPVLSMYRFIFAGLFMLFFARIKHIRLPKKRDIPLFILSACMGFSLYQLLFNKGIDMLTSATACIIIATAPVLTALFARVLFHETIRLGGWLGIGVCFVGILVLMLWNGVLSINVGILWMMVAAMFLAGYTLLQRFLTKTYSPLQCVAYSIILGSLMLLVFMPFGGAQQATHATFRHWFATAYLGFCPSALGYFLWSKALAMAPRTAEVSNLQFIQPALAMLFGFLVVREVPTLDMYIGAGIIIVGLILFSAKK